MNDHGSTGSLMSSIVHVSSNGEPEPSPRLTSSASLKARTRKPSNAAAAGGSGGGGGGVITRAGSDVDEIITLLHGSDPVRVELNRLENDLRGSHSLSFFFSLRKCFLEKILECEH